MDHLRTPKDSVYTAAKVPLLCDGQYDKDDFSTYPSRAGDQWKHFDEADQVKYSYIESSTPSKDDEFACFLQKWLFFGLLYEVLKDLYDATHYIEHSSNGSFVHTRELRVTLTRWAERVGNIEEPVKTQRCQYLHACLRKAWSVLWCLRPNGGHDGFDPSVKMSLITLFDTISCAWDMIFADVHGELNWLPAFNSLGTLSADEMNIMKSNNWCQSVITREAEDTNSPAFRWYIKSMQQYPTDICHDQCGPTGCEAEQIVESTYEPRHTTAECKCEMAGPDESKLAAILDSGKYAVLDVHGDLDTLTINVIPYENEEKQPYVAFSHVWADGLGNPAALKLPKCQILRLRGYLEALAKEEYVWPGNKVVKDTRKLYLWVDPILCPVVKKPPPGASERQKSEFNARPDVQRSAQLKMKALSHMRSVYIDATYVLVLDRGLEACEFHNSDMIDAAVRILTSRWMQRLWTYQEAALPVKLLVQFSNRAVDYRDIVLEMRKLYQSDIVLRSLCSTLAERMIQLRAFRYQPDRKFDLMVFSRHYHFRRCTEKADEPICAAALLDLDIGEVAAAYGIEQRMAVLWQLLAKRRGVPQDIIFVDVPRLNFPGFRWAPATLMKGLARRSDPVPARLTNKGLCVKLQCWRLEAGVLPWVPKGFLFQELASQSMTDHGQLFAHDPQGSQWYRLSLSEGDDVQAFWQRFLTIPDWRALDWHLLLELPLTATASSMPALFGFVDRGGSGSPVFRSVAILQASRWSGPKQAITQAAWEHARYLRNCEAYRRYQLVIMCTTLLSNLLKARPMFNRLGLTYIARRFFLFLERFHAGQVIIHYMQRVRPDAQSDDVTDAIVRTPDVGGLGHAHLGADTIVFFHGHMVTISKIYNETTEWCVD